MCAGMGDAGREAERRASVPVSGPASPSRYPIAVMDERCGSAPMDQDRARIVAEAELRFPESGFVLTLRPSPDFSQPRRSPPDRLRGVGLRVIARGADDFRDRHGARHRRSRAGVRSLAGRDQGELPSQIERVLNPAVHPVAFDRAAGVGRVAGKQHPPRAEPRRDPGVGMEELRLVRTRDARARREHFQTMRDMGLMRANGRIGAEVRPPDIPADRNRDKSGSNMAAAKSELVRPVGEAQVGHAPLLIIVVPREARSPTASRTLLWSPSAPTSQLGSRVRSTPFSRTRTRICLVVGLEIDELDPAFDAASQPLELFGQDLPR